MSVNQIDVNAVNQRLKSENHSDYVDAFAYVVAAKEMEMRDSYILLHVKSRPWWLPEVIYKWILSKVLCLNEFKKRV